MKAPEVKRILYTSDLGKKTRPVFHQAISLANSCDADIIMLHVVEPISYTALAMIETYLPSAKIKEKQEEVMTETIDTMKKRLELFAKEELDKDKAEATKVQEVFVVAGKPSEEILRIAEEQNADLIVMGKSTHKIKGRRVIGSTAKRVSRYAKIPVLLVSNNS